MKHDEGSAFCKYGGAFSATVFYLISAKPDLGAGFLHQPPECGIIFPGIGVALVEFGARVQAHIEGCQNVSRVEITAIVEFDALTQRTGPDRKILVRLTRFRQVRYRLRTIDRKAI